MLFLQLTNYSNGFSVILEKPILSFGFIHPAGHFGHLGGRTQKTKSVFLKLRTNHWSNSLAVKTTFFTLYLSNLNPEDEVFSSKIDRLMTNCISKLKWAWRAQFLSRVLVILKISVSFEDKQMILVSFFDIFAGFRFPKNLKSLPIQFLRHPWLSLA